MNEKVNSDTINVSRILEKIGTPSVFNSVHTVPVTVRPDFLPDSINKKTLVENYWRLRDAGWKAPAALIKMAEKYNTTTRVIEEIIDAWAKDKNKK